MYLIVMYLYFHCVDVDVMLSAPQEVLEEEGSMINACILIAENALLEREITVTFSTIANQRNQQGIVVLAC